MDYLTAWVIMVLLLDGQSLSEESFFFSYCRDMLKLSGGWYRVMSKKAQRSKQIERSCKKLYLEERKSREITREMRKMSQGASPYYYRGMKQIDDVQYFLELRNEAERIYSNSYGIVFFEVLVLKDTLKLSASFFQLLISAFYFE